MKMMRNVVMIAAAAAAAICVNGAPTAGGNNPKGSAVDDSNWRGGPTEDWFVNWDKALAEAKKTGKAMFVLKTGDWSSVHGTLRKQVLQNDKFLDFARKKLVLVYLNDAKSRPLGKEQRKHNWFIAETLGYGHATQKLRVFNSNGAEIESDIDCREQLDEFLEKLERSLAELRTKPVAEKARRLFSEGYDKMSSEFFSKNDLFSISTNEFKVALTGIAIGRTSRRYGNDVEFLPPGEEIGVPWGSPARFRIEYDVPKGFKVQFFVREKLESVARMPSRLGFNYSQWCTGKGVAYPYLRLMDRAESHLVRNVEVRIATEPALDGLPYGWGVGCVPVNLNFMAESEEQRKNRPAVSKYVPKGWTEDFEATRRQAAREGKFILAVFSGSDWCGPCMALEKEVLSQEEFVRKASEKYVLVMIAFPHDESTLSKLAVAQNNALKKRYPIRGYPTIMVINPFDGEVVKRRSGYKSGSGVDAYMQRLSEMVEGVEWPKPGAMVKPLPRIEDKVEQKQGEGGKSSLERLREKKKEKPWEGRLAMLESMLSAEDALKLAQKGEARGFYQLAISYAKKAAANDDDKDVRNNDFATSDKCLARAVEMCYGNALMLHAIDVAHDKLFSLKVCARHRHANDWYLCAGMQKCTFENTDLDSHTMKIDAFADQKTVAEVVAAFERAEKAGVANASVFAHYITNELAQTARIKRDRRTEDARMTAKLDDGVAKLLGPSPVGAARTGKDLKAPLLGGKNGPVFSAAQPLPFAEAVRKAKDGDGYALYSVAMQYADGSEIARDGVRAAKYLQKAADVGFGDAVFANTLLKESTLCGHRYRYGEALLLRRSRGFSSETAYGDFRSYTGARPTDFKLNNDGFWNITNEIAVTEIRSGYIRAAELGVTQATNALERFDGWLLTRRNEIRKEMDEERQWREKITSNAKLAKEFLGEEPSTNAVFQVRLLPGEAAVGEQQRQTLLQIQESLRRRREGQGR